ncbi:MSHA biogenesis protein MshE [Spiribacter sp. SSL99]|uniref:GspE/PulE family protein n=1 Tax=Spiribacter sp. SSL99 TaxID=1866884 RepID=UPI0013307AFA|nr:ATPase, T2SS/T4P/T4SS family [Spiribacter sp. SSL99]KAF0285892.1 MSHA biogenesis protein MshE [Spiribacter sp. SSL99]
MATARPERPQRLGDQLIERGLISEADLKAALDEQKRTGLAVGEALVQMGRLAESDLNTVLAEHYGVRTADPAKYWVDKEVAQQLPENAARRFGALILEETGEEFVVATDDPGDIMALDEVERILPKPVEFRLAGRQEIIDTINMVYARTDELESIADEITEEIESSDEIDLTNLNVGTGRASSPAVRLLKTLMEDAIQRGVSDIHIEPEEKELRIRTRKDGILHERLVRQGNMQNALVSLLKLMAGLNITERRLPQDGRFQSRVQGRRIDVRLSTLPQQHGESVVMRLLDQSAAVSSLDQTGMAEDLRKRFRSLMTIPNGLILVTGPTGSGKSTTLYGALSEMNTAEVKIITVEDPVEYALHRVTQVQVREQIGLNFSRVLRTSLRQDPDIVMVGEIRDAETADIAMRAAITGHRVLSTLHTNDAVSSANRLLDMGIEPFMLAAALRGVLAQRLLRRVCSQCAETRPANEEEIAWLTRAGHSDPDGLVIHEGRGCPLCEQSGYSGRIGLFELVEVDAGMRQALRQRDVAAFAERAQSASGYVPLVGMALEFIEHGQTNVAEVVRVLGERIGEAE